MSKIQYKIINKDNVKVEGDMDYYIKYVDKILYPESVKVEEDESGKYIDIRTTHLTNEDDYKIFIVFDKNGKFFKGGSLFFISGFEYIPNQFEFKKKIKKEINMINNIHGATKNLIDYMGGQFARTSMLNPEWREFIREDQ